MLCDLLQSRCNDPLAVVINARNGWRGPLELARSWSPCPRPGLSVGMWFWGAAGTEERRLTDVCADYVAGLGDDQESAGSDDTDGIRN